MRNLMKFQTFANRTRTPLEKFNVEVIWTIHARMTRSEAKGSLGGHSQSNAVE